MKFEDLREGGVFMCHQDIWVRIPKIRYSRKYYNAVKIGNGEFENFPDDYIVGECIVNARRNVEWKVQG